MTLRFWYILLPLGVCGRTVPMCSAAEGIHLTESMPHTSDSSDASCFLQLPLEPIVAVRGESRAPAHGHEQRLEVGSQQFASHQQSRRLSHSKSGGRCSEGDPVYDFEVGRDCSAFTDDELDEPLSKWPYLTRWCKIFASGGDALQSDGCMAQECIANQNPAAAATVWWETKAGKDPSFQAMEAGYCWISNMCSSDYGLTQNSTLHDMEDYCDKHYPTWRLLTPRDWLQWLAGDFSVDVLPLTCAWGTLHCDATRCKKYLCGDQWKRMVHVAGVPVDS